MKGSSMRCAIAGRVPAGCTIGACAPVLTMMMAAVLAAAMVLAAVAAAGAVTVTGDRLDTFERNLSGALLDMGLVPSDCRIRSDYAAPDSFRLPLVDSLMNDPTSLLRRVDGIAAGIEEDTSLAGEVTRIWRAMSIEATSLAAPNERLGIRLDKKFRTGHARWDYFHPAERIPLLGSHVTDIRGRLAHLPRAVNQRVAAYLRRLDTLTLARGIIFENIAGDMDFLRANSAFLVTPRQEYDNVSPFELDSLDTADTALGDSILHLSERIEVSGIAIISATAVEAAEHLASHLVDFGETHPSTPHARQLSRYNGGKVTFAGKTSTVTGKILYLGATDWGPVVIGDSLSNTYDGAFALIIDLGGDDIYDLASNPAISFDLIIDQAGHDVYRSKDNAALAGSIFGTSIVMDLAGDDTYQARDISLGSGVFGTGILYDRKGSDTYTSGAFSQGSGFLGVGLLRDDAGNDSYTAAMQSQAFGYVMGSGVMLERGGNDIYFTKMSQTDILRYDDHYLSLSQGCAFGSRPDYSGGIGLLIDSAGNDLYSSDIFGQGAGYWYCVGALIDRGGHDCYRSYQYAQGSGIHLGFGLLLDQWGNDYYVSKGVSQGCGHDLALGLLADLSGNDCYTAVDLSQGAGSANGTGILYDADGVDAYSAKSKINVNGYGDYRREFGSIGLEIDVKGTDFYAARGKNDSLWEGGRYGLGVDIPGEASKPTGDIIVNQYPFKERAFTTRELYVLAMRSEPRFQSWKTFAFNRMVDDSAASIDYLRTVLDTKDATKRNAIKDILVKIGAPAVPMLCDEVSRGNDLAKAEASWILGLIGDAGGFDALIELTYSENWKHRSSALNSLARLKSLSADDEARLEKQVAAVLGDGNEVFYVKKDAAFVAGSRNYLDLASQLVGCLDDSHYSVRYSSAEALRQLSKARGSATAHRPSTAQHSPDRIVLDALKAALPVLTTEGFIAAIYGGSDLPPDGKIDLLEAGLGTQHAQDPHGALALARLASACKPTGPQQQKRLESLTARLPRDSWEVKAILKR